MLSAHVLLGGVMSLGATTASLGSIVREIKLLALATNREDCASSTVDGVPITSGSTYSPAVNIGSTVDAKNSISGIQLRAGESISTFVYPGSSVVVASSADSTGWSGGIACSASGPDWSADTTSPAGGTDWSAVNACSADSADRHGTRHSTSKISSRAEASRGSSTPKGSCISVCRSPTRNPTVLGRLLLQGRECFVYIPRLSGSVRVINPTRETMNTRKEALKKM
ncbi:hypothetical protein BC629DRAFT_399494 [Irpex lacteus]|nr:hypothetical protein BC629DRAFT_399494 [Irpex lacteus]